MRLFFSAILALAMMASGPSWAQDRLQAFNQFDESGDVVVDHSAYAAFLTRYLRVTEDDRTVVAYGDVTDGDREALKSYIRALEAVDPTALGRDEAFAYWANFYNALTLDVVLGRYPVGSILRITSGLRPGPWKRKLVTVNGQRLSLDNMEHGILRAFFDDNRVHYAVNCASYGCPNLAEKPFTGATLDAMLDRGARRFINHPRGVSVENGEVSASSIYKWFREDFGDSEAGVLAHFRQYADENLKAQLDGVAEIEDHRYDWSLNDAKDEAGDLVSLAASP
ncbi:MAG: DUF547 domain-containing protein [Pseudomonadota bacterium]